MVINADVFISVKGYKALGNQITDKKIKTVELKEALPYNIPEDEDIHDIEVDLEEDEAISEEQKGDDSQITLDF